MTAQVRMATDAPQVLRDVAEQSAVAAGEATDFLKHSFATTVKRTHDYNTKVLEFTNANIKGAVEHATKLMSVKSPPEFFALSNDYAKRQFEILTRQAQELAAIVQKMTMAKDR